MKPYKLPLPVRLFIWLLWPLWEMWSASAVYPHREGKKQEGEE